MASLRAQKKKRYDEVIFQVRRRWTDLKMCTDGLKDRDLIESTARSADVSESMASKVLYRKRRSKRVLQYLNAGVEYFRKQHNIPKWLV